MISPDIFKIEDKNIVDKKQNIISSMGIMLIRNFESTINRISGKTIFKVQIEKGEQEDILRKILGLLHSISFYLKSPSSPQQQKISIKTTDLVTLNKSIEDILKKIEAKEFKINIPSISKVQGTVKVENFPSQYPFEKLYGALSEIKTALSNIRLEVPAQKDIKFPDIKIPSFPKIMGVSGMKEMIGLLKDVKKGLDELPKQIPKMEFPNSVSVNNFPPQKYPMPVTNININPLRGFVKTRNITITTSLTPLPDEVLSNRRSLVIFNNSSQTVYVGGSDVTTTNGMPVPQNSYSPAFDAGPRMIVYGIVSSSTADVRVMELSNENIGG